MLDDFHEAQYAEGRTEVEMEATTKALIISIVLIISTWLIVMMRLMIQQILIMKIISSTCNTMFFSNYVLFILHFLITSCLSFLISNYPLFFLSNCRWLNRQRKVFSLYQRTRPTPGRCDLYSLSLPDPSTEHGHKHSHTPTARDSTAADCVTSGDLYFISCSLIFTYLRFALFKYYGNVVGPGPGFRGPAGGRSTKDRGYGGLACGGVASTATADGGDSLVHAISWATYGFSCATFAIRYSLFPPPPPPPAHSTPISMSTSV